MQRLSFLAKLALIFNVVYVIEFIIKFTAVFKPGQGTMFSIPGAAIISPILNLSLLFALILSKKKDEPLSVQKWLWATCLMLLFFQAVSFFIS